MKTIRWLVIACVLSMLRVMWAANAQQGTESPARDPATEQVILDRLGRIAPDAVPLFQQATQALDAGDFTQAKGAYNRVLALAPGFPDALRRLSYVEASLGNMAAAIDAAQKAYDADPSPHNQMALAQALIMSEDQSRAAEALEHAQAAAETLPDDAQAQQVLMFAGFATQDDKAIRQGSAAFLRLAPASPVAHYGAGLVFASDGQWERAERELLRAQELGMPAEAVQSALDQGVRSQALLHRWLRRGRNALIAWVTTTGVLFGAGMLLSKLTLAAVSRQRSSIQVGMGHGERIVRLAYRLVIALSSVYFYVSIPLLVIIVLALVGLVFYLFLVIGRIPIQLAIFILLATFYTLVAVVRSIFVRFDRDDPGRILPPEEAPALWALVRGVAQTLGTRAVDDIYVTPGAGIAVIERGTWLARLRDRGKRCLLLGLGALPGMTENEFRAILAHEYGHFSHRDTAGGNLAHRVSASIYAMAVGLAASGQGRWYNPAWIFVNAFHRVFMRITLGASRLQEILADRYAAMAYGVQNFTNGLMRLIRQSLTFDAQITHEIQVAMSLKTSLPSNLYTLPPMAADLNQKEVEEKLAETLSAPTSAYDSHPAPWQRFAMIEHLPQTEMPGESGRLVTDLIGNVEQLQQEMTAIVQDNVRRAQDSMPPVIEQAPEPDASPRASGTP